MKKNRTLYKRLLILALSILMLVATASIFITVTADSPDPSLTVEGKTLVLEDRINLRYIIKIEGADCNDVEMLYWTSPQASYTKGTEESYSKHVGTQTVDDAECYTFDYTNLAAKQMIDEIYARAYVKVDGVDYYSEVIKYSILQYAYNQLNKSTTTEQLATLLHEMLDYGAAAQLYFNYKTDRLATADFYQISVNGGISENGEIGGLYLTGEQITLTASETDADGIPFAYWQNSAGENISGDRIYTATVGTQNEIYTAIYELPVTPDTYFTFTLQSDDTYDIKAKDVSNMPAKVVLPAIYNEKPVTMIARNAFYNCTAVTDIIIPESIKRIGTYAFQGCTALKNISIPDSVQIIDDYAFYNCIGLSYKTYDGAQYLGNENNPLLVLVKPTSTAISSLYIHQETKIIYTEAFKNCTALTNVTIPNTISSIGRGAFNGCTGLSSLTVPFVGEARSTSYTHLGYIFGASSYNNSKTYVPTSLKTVIMSEGTSLGSNAFYQCTSLTSITLPETLESIANNAFYGCSGLASISLPDNLKTIGNYAFYQCTKLSNITIPDQVTKIEYGTFSGCTRLTQVNLGSGITDIGSQAFQGCTNLTGITIPDRVENIGNSAFADCSKLTTITLGNGVTSIANSAFWRCKLLTTVYYNGNAEEWSGVNIVTTNNDYLIAATVYYYSMTTPTQSGNYWHYVSNTPTAW